MNDFAIIAEGYTDQVVIRSVLLGFFEDAEEEPIVNFEQPLEDATGQQMTDAPGGWDQVVKYFELGRYKQALQLNRFLIVHIDTDVLVSEKTRLAIRTRDSQGNELGPEALIDDVVEKFHDLIGTEILRDHGERFIFAVAVHSTECWLLPLIFQDRRKSKITGCLNSIDRELNKRGSSGKLTPLRKGDGKDPKSYQALSRSYSDRKTLMHHAHDNPSLSVFVHELERRHIVLSPPDEV